MVSIIGLDSEKVQQLCDAANQEVDEHNKVQIANYLCPVSLFYTQILISLTNYLCSFCIAKQYVMDLTWKDL